VYHQDDPLTAGAGNRESEYSNRDEVQEHGPRPQTEAARAEGQDTEMREVQDEERRKSAARDSNKGDVHKDDERREGNVDSTEHDAQARSNSTA
jgi:hypothetical protein